MWRDLVLYVYYMYMWNRARVVCYWRLPYTEISQHLVFLERSQVDGDFQLLKIIGAVRSNCKEEIKSEMNNTKAF